VISLIYGTQGDVESENIAECKIYIFGVLGYDCLNWQPQNIYFATVRYH